MQKSGTFLLLLVQFFLTWNPNFAQLQNGIKLDDKRLTDEDRQVLADLEKIRQTLEKLGKENFLDEARNDAPPSEIRNDVPITPPPPTSPPLILEIQPSQPQPIPQDSFPPAPPLEPFQPPKPPPESFQPPPTPPPLEPFQPPKPPTEPLPPPPPPNEPPPNEPPPPPTEPPQPPPEQMKPNPLLQSQDPPLLQSPPPEPSPVQLQAPQAPGARTYEDFEKEEAIYAQTPAKPVEIRRKFLGHDQHVIAIASLARKMLFGQRHGLPPIDPKECPSQEPPICNAAEKYRRYDGACNNLKYPLWGAYLQPYERFINPEYEDGVYAPRGAKFDEKLGYLSRLPSPRAISKTLFKSKNETSGDHTHMLMMFGQFIDHDLTRATKQDFNCCDSAIMTKCRCFNIDLFEDDFFYRNHSRSCMEFTRSNIHCQRTKSWWEQFNGVTSFMDGSGIYGSNNNTAQKLRSGENGKLMTGKDLNNFLPTRKECGVLPDFPNQPDDFVAGDERVETHATLLSMHVLWMREHNRVASSLAQVLKDKLRNYDQKEFDELVFQESRKIVIAEFQNVAYREYFPNIFNDETLRKHHLTLEKESEYLPTINPTIRNEFSAAAFRYGHSQVQDVFKGTSQPWRLGKFYGDPIFAVRSNGDGYQREIEGACNQEALKVDRYITKELTRNLFNSKKFGNGSEGWGSDLGSINIQRGRDHGIPSYNTLRKFIGLTPINSMKEGPPEISSENWEDLAKVYKSPDEIDVYPAGLSETPLPGAILGPTMTFFVAEQFRMLKDGDRFFFTHTKGENARGLPENLQRMIFERKFSDIICGITTIEELQKIAFRKANEGNPLIKCKDPYRPKLDFEAIAQQIMLDKKKPEIPQGVMPQLPPARVIEEPKLEEEIDMPESFFLLH